MINEFKKELIDYGSAQLLHYAPKELDLYKSIEISKLLDCYSDKWVALNNMLQAKRKEILNRPEINQVDLLTLENEFERAVVTVRNKFTTTYPLNL